MTNTKEVRSTVGRSFLKATAVILALSFIVFYMLPVTSISNAAKKNAVKVTKVKISNSSDIKTLYVGDTETIEVKVNVKGNKKAAKAAKKVSFKSSKSTVASVNAKGVITAKKAGKTVITVTSKKDKKKKTSITVTVKNCPATQAVFAYKNLYFTAAEDTESSFVNNSVKLEDYDNLDCVYSLRHNATIQKASDFKWKSSDESVATVDKNGKISITGFGTAVITATYKTKKSTSASFTIHVLTQDEFDAGVQNGSIVEEEEQDVDDEDDDYDYDEDDDEDYDDDSDYDDEDYDDDSDYDDSDYDDSDYDDEDYDDSDYDDYEE
ncbi:MAG: Ig-like domain-containing protein [Eubacterium sp.]|nr:Ig-like domain-containing protein [Eubacterium sp.]